MRALLLAAIAAASATAHADAAFVATRIDAANHAALSPGGPDATGGVGDWALSNGVLCAVVADPVHESDLAVGGGGLVDLGHCGRGDDQLVLLQPLANLDRRGALSVERIEAHAGADVAALTGFGTLSGCAFETRFALDPRDPARLVVTTRVTRREPGARIFALGDVVLHAQHAIRPFALDSRARVPAIGFAHPPLDLDSPFSVARATRPSETRILVGAQPIEPGIAYALRAVRAVRIAADGAAAPVSVASLSAENFSGIAAFAGAFWLGGDRLGPLQMAQTLFLDLELGESLLLEREILVSRRADAASLTDRLLEGGVRVSARVADANARVELVRSDGRVATHATPSPDGRFSVLLPPGSYRARVLGSMGGETQRAFDVRTAPLDLGALEAPPLGVLTLPHGVPMRLVFRGVGATPDPRFGDERPPVTYGEDAPPASTLTRDVSLAGAASDPASVVLAPGLYRVTAGRGLEFGITEAEVEVVAGARATLAIAPPERALSTPGWIGADLHVHAAPSDDSALPLALRIASHVAEGAEVMVATDHELVTDYAPLIRELGLAGAIASVVGQEVTSSVSTPEAPTTFGHANVFPLVRRPTEYRGGGLPNEGRRLRDVIHAVRALGGERIVQLNHARSGADEQGFFDHLSIGSPFDARMPLDRPPNAVLVAPDPATGLRDVDFDVLELWNGPSMDRYRQLREDWFALLRHGIVRTGTANSDSHLLREVAATPRNLVRLDGDGSERFDEAAFVRAIRAGRVVGTSGPIVDARVGDAAIGETHRGREGAIRIDVAAAPWVPVERVRAYVNGVLAHETEASNGDTVWFPHRWDADAFVTVEVEGTAAPGSPYADRLPGFTPFAFTNPIFVDADGDGAWKPPAGARPTP